MDVNRRCFLRTLCQTAVAANLTGLSRQAAGQKGSSRQFDTLNNEAPNDLVFARFRFQGHQRTPDEWDTLPQGDDNLLRYVESVTNIRMSKKSWQERVVSVDDFEKMRTTPIIFMTGQVDFDFAKDEVEALDEYFKRGGFLYADDCDADVGNAFFFYDALVREIRTKFSAITVQPVPLSHEIYHCFYDMPGDSPWNPRCLPMRPRYPDMGFFYKDRMVGFLTPSDQHCHWALRRPMLQRETKEMGTNIIVYALTH